MRKRNRQWGSAAASVHNSSLIRCRGNVDQKCSTRTRARGFGPALTGLQPATSSRRVFGLDGCGDLLPPSFFEGFATLALRASSSMIAFLRKPKKVTSTESAFRNLQIVPQQCCTKPKSPLAGARTCQPMLSRHGDGSSTQSRKTTRHAPYADTLSERLRCREASSPKNSVKRSGSGFRIELSIGRSGRIWKLPIPRPERGAPTISKRKSPDATHVAPVAERHSNDWFGAGSSRAAPLRLNAAPIHSDINSGSKSVPRLGTGLGGTSRLRYGIQ